MGTVYYLPKYVPFTRPPTVDGRPSTDLQSIGSGWWEHYTAHPGDGLTARRIVGIFRAAEEGWPAEQCDLFEDVIENDGHLRSLVETRSDAVAGKEWVIQAGGEDVEDIAAAALLADALGEVDNFQQMIEHQLTTPPYGYAISEMQWAKVDGIWAPNWFENVAHRRFAFDIEDQPRLTMPDNFWPGVPLDAGRYFYTHRRHRLTVRAGYMRTAVWWALFKRLAIRDWVTFCSRFGIPFVIGQYRDDMPEKEKEAVRKAVEIIGSDGYAAFSEGGTIQFAKAEFGSGSDVHPQLASFCNAEMSKLISGATLTSGEGTSTGSYALGRVHENVSFTIVQKDAKLLGDMFAQQVAKPFCVWNGLDARPPRLKIHVVREQDPSARMDIWSRAANELGLEGDEDQFRQEFQLKRPRPGADPLVGTKSKGSSSSPPGAPPETPPAPQDGP